jgi:hypothetical protein
MTGKWTIVQNAEDADGWLAAPGDQQLLVQKDITLGFTICNVHKKWKPEAGLECFSLDIGGKNLRLRVSSQLLDLSIDG